METYLQNVEMVETVSIFARYRKKDVTPASIKVTREVAMILEQQVEDYTGEAVIRRTGPARYDCNFGMHYLEDLIEIAVEDLRTHCDCYCNHGINVELLRCPQCEIIAMRPLH